MSIYSKGSMRVAWKEGLIGKLESFWIERFPVKELYCRGLATGLGSLACSKMVIRNRIGRVYPIMFLLAIDDVSSFKTPPLMALRRAIIRIGRGLLDPPKFTPPGFVEHVCGRKKRKDMEATNPHPVGLILRDEISKLNAERTTSAYASLLGFLCELWDGWIEGSQTRTYGFEGGLHTHHSMTATSNYHFLETLDEDFWLIGLGARALFVTALERGGATDWDEDFFFPEWDEREEELYKEIKVIFNQIRSHGKPYVNLEQTANKRWREYDKQCREETRKEKDKILKTLRSKRGHLALRLAIIYSASVTSFNENMLEILLEDVDRAIKDVEEYFKNAKMLVEKWRKVKTKKEEKRGHTSKYDLMEMMTWMTKPGKGYCSPTEIKGAFFLSNVTLIKDKLEIGCAHNPAWIEEIVPEGQLVQYLKLDPNVDGKMYERFKPRRGGSPTVYKITEEGRKEVEKNLQ